MRWNTPKCCWTTLRFVQKEINGDWVFLSAFWLSVFTLSLQSAPKESSTQPSSKDSGKYVDNRFILKCMCFPCFLWQSLSLVFFPHCVPGVQEDPLLHFPQNTSGKVHTGATRPLSSAFPSASTRWQQITWTSPTASCTAMSIGRWQTTLPKRTKVGLFFLLILIFKISVILQNVPFHSRVFQLLEHFVWTADSSQ